jgi:hypothetical protein
MHAQVAGQLGRNLHAHCPAGAEIIPRAAIELSFRSTRELESLTMTTSKANPKVDAFIANAKKWPEELKKLRAILSTLN